MAEITFGEWLRRERKLLRLTQAQLAEQIGCSAIALRKSEAEERRPSSSIIDRLADIFAVASSDRAAFLRFARGDWQAAPASILTSPAWRVERAPQSRLPAPVTSFIGCERDVANVQEYLAEPTTRLVTLIGAPGIGKTRLSLQVATEVQEDFADGVFFVSLAQIADPNLVAPAMVRVLGLVQTDQRSALERLKDGINGRSLLIVLDNFEHIVEAASLLPELLIACPRLKLIVTSRESLRVSGEWLYLVRPLPTPTEAQTKTLAADAVDQFAALRLFAERARAVRSDFALTLEDIPAIAAICRRLDGLPLAIELIAARIRLMSPRALLSQLTSDFTLHTDGMRGVPPRQKTLYNAIAWSYDLLSHDEQVLLARLSVFAGGFTLDAAQTVTRSPSVMAGLTSLLDKSLVVRTIDAKGSEARLNLLMMIRDFALDRLHESNEEAALRDRHATCFLDLAERGDREIHGPQQAEWIDRLDGEYDNYQRALEWYVSNQKTEEALRLISALGWTWLVRGYLSDGRTWFDRIIRLGNAADFPDSYGKGLTIFGLFDWYQGDYSCAHVLLEQAQTLYQTLGTRGMPGLAQALDYLGLVVLWGEGDIEGARNLFEAAVELCRSCEDARGYAQAIHHLAGLRRSQKNQYGRVLPLLEESLTIFSQLGDTWSVGRMYHNLCGLLTIQQDYAKARLFAEQALANARFLDFKTGIATDLIDLGTICMAQDDDEKALCFYQASLDVSRQYGMHVDEAIALFARGLPALKRRDYRFAKVILIESLTLFLSQGDRINIAECLAGLAAVAAGMIQAEHAAHLMGWEEEVFGAIDYEMLPIVRLLVDQHMRLASDHLGSSAYEARLAEGRAMTFEQAIELAISGKME